VSDVQSQPVPDHGEADDVLVAEAAPPAELVETDLLVEDVSIDGMCGVY
jgi:mycofactocin precursor